MKLKDTKNGLGCVDLFFFSKAKIIKIKKVKRSADVDCLKCSGNYF